MKASAVASHSASFIAFLTSGRLRQITLTRSESTISIMNRTPSTVAFALLLTNPDWRGDYLPSQCSDVLPHHHEKEIPPAMKRIR